MLVIEAIFSSYFIYGSEIYTFLLLFFFKAAWQQNSLSGRNILAFVRWCVVEIMPGTDIQSAKFTHQILSLSCLKDRNAHYFITFY